MLNSRAVFVISFLHLILIALTEAPQRSSIRNNKAGDTDTMGIILTFILIQQDVLASSAIKDG